MNSVEIRPAATLAFDARPDGAGASARIASMPASAQTDDPDLLWQVTVTRLEGRMSFAAVAGLDRHVALVGGAPDGQVVLACPDPQFSRTMAVGADPFAFQGEWPVTCAPVGGRPSVLTVTTRRGRAAASVRCLSVRAPTVVEKRAGEATVVVLCDGTARVTGGGSSGRLLEPGDAVVLRTPPCAQVTLAPAGMKEARLLAVTLASL